MNRTLALSTTLIVTDQRFRFQQAFGAHQRTAQPDILTHNNSQRNAQQQLRHPALASKRREKSTGAYLLADARRDTAGNIYTAGGASRQRQVAGLGAVDLHKQVERRLGERVLFNRGGMDRGSRIALLKCFGHRLRFRDRPAAVQKGVQTRQPATGQNVFVRCTTDFLNQPVGQFQLQGIGRSEVHMPTFGGHNQILIAMSHQDCLTKPRAGTEYRTRTVGYGLSGLQHQHLVIIEELDAVTHRLEIVHQTQLRYADGARQFCAFDDPRQIGDVNRIVSGVAPDWPRDGKAGGVNRGLPGSAPKIGNDIRKAGVLLAIEALLGKYALNIAVALGEQQSRACTSDVAGQVT